MNTLLRTIQSIFVFPILLITLSIAVSCNEDSDPTKKVEEEEVTNLPGTDPAVAASDCYPAFEDLELNVVTWNIQFFPKNDDRTVERVQAIIQDLDADIIAVQEISDGAEFMTLAANIDGWAAAYSDVRYAQEIGYLYKEYAFTSVSTLTQLFDDDSNFFPRQVVRFDVTHASGLEVTFMNLHLKCCGADNSPEQDRREGASIAIKEYVDTNLSDKAVIVIGDFNDEITGLSTPFQNFIDDSNNYEFADMAIAEGNEAGWSYPSWPSHIDHILITDELFDKVRNVQTVLPEDCVIGYDGNVSDHRPVLASFK